VVSGRPALAACFSPLWYEDTTPTRLKRYRVVVVATIRKFLSSGTSGTLEPRSRVDRRAVREDGFGSRGLPGREQEGGYGPREGELGYGVAAQRGDQARIAP